MQTHAVERLIPPDALARARAPGVEPAHLPETTIAHAQRLIRDPERFRAWVRELPDPLVAGLLALTERADAIALEMNR